MPTLTFPLPLNVSIQPGDVLYGSKVVNEQGGTNHPAPIGNTKPYKFGIVTNVDHASRTVVYNIITGSYPLQSGHYIFFSKDNRVNTSGITGYFAHTKFINTSTLPAEIFATAVEYVESSK